MPRRFTDRTEAGRALAERLGHLADQDCIVLALPRGALPVAYEVAHALRAPLDVLNVRKLGVPSQPELAMGAVATGGVRVLNDDVIRDAGVSMAEIEIAMDTQRQEIDRRERLYRGGRPAPRLEGRTVIVVDDGIATGATVRAAIAVVRAQKPRRLVLATPVAAASTIRALSREVDEVVCASTPTALFAIGMWYDAFPQLTDADVQAVLAQSGAEAALASTAQAGAASRAPDSRRSKSHSSTSSPAPNSASQIVSPSPVTHSTK
jgi:putative phosphoribosyl transferase